MPLKFSACRKSLKDVFPNIKRFHEGNIKREILTVEFRRIWLQICQNVTTSEVCPVGSSHSIIKPLKSFLLLIFYFFSLFKLIVHVGLKKRNHFQATYTILLWTVAEYPHYSWHKCCPLHKHWRFITFYDSWMSRWSRILLKKSKPASQNDEVFSEISPIGKAGDACDQYPHEPNWLLLLSQRNLVYLSNQLVEKKRNERPVWHQRSHSIISFPIFHKDHSILQPYGGLLP